MAQVLLTNTNINSGNPVYVLAKDISLDFSKSNSGAPNANYDGTVVPRRVSGNIDVPKYVITCTLQETPATINSYTVMTQSLLKDFIAQANDDSDPTTLNIIYGDSTQWTSFQKVSGTRVDEIPVTFSKVGVAINAREGQGYKPSYTMTLEEVKKEV